MMRAAGLGDVVPVVPGDYTDVARAGCRRAAASPPAPAADVGSRHPLDGRSSTLSAAAAGFWSAANAAS
jgi:hypothetical protein